MIQPMRRRALLAGGAALAGCSVLPERPYQARREWPLEVHRPAGPPEPPTGRVLLVRDVGAAPGLEARGLRTLLPDGAERLDNWEEWAVPPPQGVQACLVQWLQASGRFAAVVTPGSQLPADLVLESELLMLLADLSTGQARATLSVLLLHGPPGRRVVGMQRSLRGAAPLGGTDGPALAAAMSAAVAEILSQTERLVS